MGLGLGLGLKFIPPPNLCFILKDVWVCRVCVGVGVGGRRDRRVETWGSLGLGLGLNF